MVSRATEPKVPNGGLAVVDGSQTSPVSGHIFLALRNGEMTFKEMLVQDTYAALIHYDRNYPSNRISPETGQFRILGRAIHAVKYWGV